MAAVKAWRPRLVCALCAALGLVLSVAAFYPGVFTPDSLEQFAQARSGDFSDWHPPAMAALWSVLNRVHEGPVLLFLLHLALLWGGLWLIGGALARVGWRWGVLFPLIGLAPFVFNYTGLLWKDVALASAWIFAAGLVFRRAACGEKLRVIEHVLIWTVVLYGALVRANSIFAAAPLALYVLQGDVFSRRLWPQAAALILTPLLLLAGAGAFNGGVLHAEKQHPEDSLFLFDLVGISHQTRSNLVPGPWTVAQARAIPDCYGADKWDHVGMGSCQFLTQTLDDRELWGGPQISHAWLAEMAAHPVEYLVHRLTFANQFFRWLGPIPVRDAFMTSEMTEPRFAHHPGAVFKAYKWASNALANTPLFRPYFWLILCAAALTLSAFATDSPQRRFASATAASAFIYLITYAPFGVASDFRYAYWSIIATLAACAALAASSWRDVALAKSAALSWLMVLAGAVAASAAT